ncbi:glutathione S-transferase A-like isoform X3 [Branchiostoma floridae]|uniref:Glutathione S-transferase A-like isoform X3 n=1 Tax=Branchiostoma floridae TaxID=7739 RepID=A0A9J7LAS5_BRAFL|nr:glutathione S-transferase A-like isoform X3 [Branchiostoma floridae]
MASDMILYWGAGSGPCWRAMICLEEKGLSDYTSKLISFDNKEHKSDEVLKINPRGQAPAFKHGNVIVNESLAICLYLENTFKAQGTKLLPDDPAQQGLVLQRAVESQNIREKAAFGVLSYFFRTKPEDRTEAMLEEKKKTCHEELQVWEGYLAKLGDGSHIAGKNFTLADVCAFPFIATLVRMGFNMSRYPHLAKYYDLVPAFKHGNVIVNESLAICLYLESTFKAQGTKLLPDDPAQQALVLQRAVESQNFRDNAAYGVLSYFFRTKPEDRTEAMLEEKKKACFEELQLWEGYLAKLGDGSHIAGKNFTLADACTFPYVATLVRMGFNLSRYPHLAKYYDLVKDRPSVKASWPPHWKDTPNKDVLKDI